MTDFNETLKAASLAVLRRELTQEERTEFLELGSALGMDDVGDYLYILMVFKRHSDILSQKLDESSELERKINGTLESSIERLLGAEASRIGEALGDEIARQAGEALSSFKEHYTIRAAFVTAAVTGVIAALAYWFGKADALRIDDASGAFGGLFLMPAGWWMLFCGASYTYFWCADNWKRLRESWLCKGLLAVQVMVMIALLKYML